MDVRQLRYFVCIAELGSLSAAAHRLGIAQPSLSQHVKHLEQELGVELLVRSSRGVSVTESGQILLMHASGVLRALEYAAAELRDHSGEPRGPVTISLPSSACNVLSVPLAEAVRRRFPQILLRVMDAMSGQVQQSLNEGEVDLGILYDFNEARHLRFTPLMVEELFLVAAAERWPHRIASNGVSSVPVRLADCAGPGLILPHRNHGLREMIERITYARGLRLNVILEMDALTNLKRLVVRGAGYSILAPAAVEDEVAARQLVLVPISDAPMRRTVYLVRNPLRMVTRAAQEVERLALELTLDLVHQGAWRGEIVADRAALSREPQGNFA